ncbi:hypothetical protein [Rhizobium paknamense]|uniref:General stress protein n=1 Tax=Rhizobium paknamense TaxID=1206817 RepID=A0ABU0IGZ2_9HYPH|nr:hypothetical protein [Rhizobium paknamense]MDQ0456489.1 hypothetical protein [Rhizobium paknamense]
MTKSDIKPDKAEYTSAGGHLGGTKFGQAPDAKTASTVEDKGRKNRPNDGSN